MVATSVCVCVCVCACLAVSDSLWPYEQSPTSLPSVHGIFQARMLEWGASSYSRGSSQPRDRSHVSCTGRGVLYHWATWEVGHQDSAQILRWHFLLGALLWSPLCLLVLESVISWSALVSDATVKRNHQISITNPAQHLSWAEKRRHMAIWSGTLSGCCGSIISQLSGQEASWGPVLCLDRETSKWHSGRNSHYFPWLEWLCRKSA